MEQEMVVRASAEINLDHAVANMKILSRLAHPAGVMAVVKADGYGHGAVACGRAFAEGGAAWLAVATIDEAIELQDAGLKLPIFILGLVEEAREQEALARGIRIVVSSLAGGRRLAGKARALKAVCPIHIKLDTGMSRIGFPADDTGITDIIELVHETDDCLRYEGLMTHFACSDADDRSTTDLQYERFIHVKDALKEADIVPEFSHVCNSAATLRFPEYHEDLVRVGLSAYGLHRGNLEGLVEGLKPVMTFSGRVSYVKNLEAGRGIGYGHINVTEEPRRIATVSAGYADGYKRSLGGVGSVSIHGRKYPVVGRVCMDALMVDVGPALYDSEDNGAVKEGDQAVLWGQTRDDEVRVEDLALLLDTIPYELTCGVTKRVPRIYIRNGKEQID